MGMNRIKCADCPHRNVCEYTNVKCPKRKTVLSREEVENYGEVKVSGSTQDFQKELFEVVNKYIDAGLSKPDCVKSVKWVRGSIKMS